MEINDIKEKNPLSNELIKNFFGKDAIFNCFDPKENPNFVLDAVKVKEYLSEKLFPENTEKAAVPFNFFKKVQTVPTIEAALSIWDFGGQKCYSSVQHMFLNDKAIYLLVFDLAKVRSNFDVEMEKIETWLEAARSNSRDSVYVFVGTRFKAVKNKQQFMNQVNRKIFEIVRLKQVNVFENKGNALFPIENSFSNRAKRGLVTDIKSAIEGAQDFLTTGDNNLGQTIPLYFLLIMDVLAKTGKVIITETEAFQLNAELGFSAAAIESALTFFHHKGVIFYDANVWEEQPNFVILNLSWLLGALARAIFDSTVRQREFRQKLGKEGGFLYDFYTIRGLISKEFLFKQIWDGYSSDEQAFLFNLCKRQNLFAEFNFPLKSTRSNENILVPSMIREFAVIDKKEAYSSVDMFQFTVYFEMKVPLGVFEKFIAMFASLSSKLNRSEQPLIAKGIAKIFMEEGFSVIIMLDETENKIDLCFDKKARRLSGEILGTFEKCFFNCSHFLRDRMYIAAKSNDGKNTARLDDLRLAALNGDQRVKVNDITVPRGDFSDTYGILNMILSSEMHDVEFYDCYVSFCTSNHEKKAFIEDIARTLSTQGFNIFFEGWETSRNLDKLRKTALENSRQVVIFLTTDYLQEWQQINAQLCMEVAVCQQKCDQMVPLYVIDPEILEKDFLLKFKGFLKGTEINLLDFSSEKQVLENFVSLVNFLEVTDDGSANSRK